MSTVTFWGATEEVTGSMHVVDDGQVRFLVDCGIYQGAKNANERNREPFPFDPRELDAVILTHAHMDHIGRIPQLVKAGYQGPIYTVSANKDFASILYEDAAEIMADDEERTGLPPIYTPMEIPKALGRFVTTDYHERIELPGGWHVVFWDAGHILGSSIVELVHAERRERIVFSGDLGNPPVPLLSPTESPDGADLVVMESTYGDRDHETHAEREKFLRDGITETIKKGGVVLIPSFALERTQEILYYLNRLREENKIPAVPIFLDSPLAIHATRIFERHLELMSPEAQKEYKVDDFFEFPGLRMTLTRDQSRTINNVPAPKVIIAGSGMMEGGRILHHAKRYLGDAKTLVLIVGYQAQGSLGRALLSGARRVKIHKESIFVRAQTRAIGAFSAHADKTQLLEWLKGYDQRPKQIALVHGERDRMHGLKAAIEQELRIPTFIPRRGDQHTVGGAGVRGSLKEAKERHSWLHPSSI